jgi:tRNA G37 N-methylase Trm5
MMAGVGPFAVPLAMPLPPPQQPKGTVVDPTHGPKNGPKHVPKNGSKTGSLSVGMPVVVHANDLNPASYRYLVENARNNKCGGALHTYNMDARYVCCLSSLGWHSVGTPCPSSIAALACE